MTDIFPVQEFLIRSAIYKPIFEKDQKPLNWEDAQQIGS